MPSMAAAARAAAASAKLGAAVAKAPASFTARFGSVFVAHAVLAVIAWGLLAPLGFAFARVLRRAGRAASERHRQTMFVVLGLTFLVWALGIAFADTAAPAGHATLGTLVALLALLQGGAGALRPPTDSGAVRAAWAAGHRILGAASIVAGMYTLHHALDVFDVSAGYARTVRAIIAVSAAGVIAAECAPERALAGISARPAGYFAEGTPLDLDAKMETGLAAVVEFREVQSDGEAEMDETGEVDEEASLAYVTSKPV